MLLLVDVTTDPTYTWLTQGGSVGILALVVIAFMKGWIVSGQEHRKAELNFSERYQQVRDERDKAMEQNAKLNEVAQRTLEAALRKVEQQ